MKPLHRVIHLAGVSLVLFLTACGATNLPADPDGGGAGNDGSGGTGGSSGHGGYGGYGGATGDASCPAETQAIYVVDSDSHFARFHPDTNAFEEIGTLACPTIDQGAHPFSMSVDRKGTAWVLYSSGELVRVSPHDASCTATTFAVNQHGFKIFGMGFVSNSVGSTEETLFIAGAGILNTHLGSIDLTTLVVTDLAQLTGTPELTGTGDAKLWAFIPETTTSFGTPHVAQIDKTTGQESGVINLASLYGTASAWAFAFWGGDFYIFLKRSILDSSTKVYKVKGSDGMLTTLVSDTGRAITGAGVSTCAPLVVQ